MALLQWNGTMSVQVERFDTEHKKLVDMLNNLHDAMLAGMGSAAIGVILNELVTYTATHFAAEESLLKQHAYPGLEAHKGEHLKLVTRALEIKKEYAEGKALPGNLLQFLKDWLMTHIMNEDKRYGTYLSAKGVK